MYKVYTRRPVQIKAWQYLTREDATYIAEWIREEGGDARVSTILEAANAEPMVKIVIKDGKSGLSYARPGDWIVKENDRWRPLSEHTFHSNYSELVIDGGQE